MLLRFLNLVISDPLMVLMLCLSGFLLAGIIFTVTRILRERGLFGRSGADQMALLEGIEGPAALSTPGGALVELTASMRDMIDGSQKTIESLVKALNPEIDAKLTYRLGKAAQRFGFAIESLHSQQEDNALHLICQRSGNQDLIWRVLAAPEVEEVLKEIRVDLLSSQPMPMIRVSKAGEVACSRGFLDLFDEGVTRAREIVADFDRDPAGRMSLKTSSGEDRSFEVFRVMDGEDCLLVLFPKDARDNVSHPVASVLDDLPLGLMQFDLSGKLLWTNRQAIQMLGQEIPAGTDIEEIFSAAGRPIAALVEEAMRGNVSRRGTMVRLTTHKSVGFMQINLIRTALEGTDSFVAVVNDASELRELEDRFAQSQKMEAVGKLAGGVAHDFNNVLTAIKGHCDFVLMGKDQTHADYDDLTQIRQNANRAAAMVRHLLAFSRQQTLQPQLLNLRDVISDAHVFLNSVIGERVTLLIEHERDLWPLMADQHQLEQVLMNLVVNARDAMGDGGTVTLTTRNMSLEEPSQIHGILVPADNYVEICVTDSGTGIPEELISRVFDPFFTTKPQGQGTGLGLSTVYGIVKQSGGFIFAENVPEGGARFRMLMPSATPSAPRESEGAPEIKRDLTGQASVLLVEDEDSIRSVGSRALKMRGYKVYEAPSAEDAIELLEDDDVLVDVLVSDVVMPGMDGPTFAVKARVMRPGLRLIFVSGYAEDNFNNAELGEDFLFLPKPFSINELTAKVKEALEAEN